jgi:hypothetical protein
VFDPPHVLWLCTANKQHRFGCNPDDAFSYAAKHQTLALRGHPGPPKLGFARGRIALRKFCIKNPRYILSRSIDHLLVKIGDYGGL